MYVIREAEKSGNHHELPFGALLNRCKGNQFLASRSLHSAMVWTSHILHTVLRVSNWKIESTLMEDAKFEMKWRMEARSCVDRARSRLRYRARYLLVTDGESEMDRRRRRSKKGG